MTPLFTGAPKAIVKEFSQKRVRRGRYISAAAAFAVSRSLRFNSADSAYLSRTPASAGNRKTWTWSGWVKRAALGNTDQTLFASSDSPGNNHTGLKFSNDKLYFYAGIDGSGTVFTLQTAAVYRDPSAWYHVVLSFDTTQSTPANRAKLYVNNTEVTAFSTSNYPAQNTDYSINQAAEHSIGRYSLYNQWFASLYLANIHFIDGYAYDPSYFGETNATTGVWDPKTYTGTYPGNSFHLDFADNSAATAAALGKDTSGNGLNWTPNNLSVTAGAGNDSLVDSPVNGTQTDTGVGGEVVGNYCTLNPLQASSNTALANGNLDISSSNATGQTLATLGVSSGKWYFEGTLITYSGTQPDPFIGISNTSNPSLSAGASSNPGYAANSYAVYLLSQNTFIQKVNNNTFTNTGTTQVSNGNVVGVAFDLDNGKFWISKNGTWLDSGNPATGANALFTGLSGSFVPAFRGSGSSTGTAAWACNFGQRPFAYTAPSGFKALCTANLPTPTIGIGSTAMDVKLYTGNGSTQTISGLNFSPDLVWIKCRSSIEDNVLSDIIRGTNKFLYSNATNAEDTAYNNVFNSFDSTGFTLGYQAGFGGVNVNSRTYAAWCWDAGSSTVSNTSGSITSSVRASASAGFSVVTFNSGGSNGEFTVGHGLGVAPKFIIMKSRTRNGGPWWVHHLSTTDTTTKYLQLSATAAMLDNGGSGSIWGAALPTSTLFGFSVGAGRAHLQNEDIVSYCFTPVDGYSSFGSYTGNGSADGPFVYTGFRPRWILFKKSSSSANAQSWNIIDATRLGYNAPNYPLYPNSSSAEVTNNTLDILSNGFKIRVGDVYDNENNGTYIYAAFAESPINYSRAR